jgi:hypothetical protein
MTLHGAPRADELRRLKEYVENGGTVWLNLARDVDTARLNALAETDDGRILPFKSLTRLSSAEPLRMIAADTAAPPLRWMNESALDALRTVSVRDGFAFDLRAGTAATTTTTALLRWRDGPAAFVYTRAGRGNFLVLGTSTESAASDLGRSPAFPSLAFSLLRAAASPADPLSYTLGEAVDLGLPPGADVFVTGDGARTNKAQARDLLQRPLSVFFEAGIYRLETEKGIRFVALNTPGTEAERALASVAEIQSLLKGAGAEAEKAAGGTRWREAAELEGNAWRYFLAAAFLLLVAELFVRVRQRGKQGAAETANAPSQTVVSRD